MWKHTLHRPYDNQPTDPPPGTQFTFNLKQDNHLLSKVLLIQGHLDQSFHTISLENMVFLILLILQFLFQMLQEILWMSLGTVVLSATFQSTTIQVDAIISTSMRDEILLSWHDSEDLGLIQITRQVVSSPKSIEHKIENLKSKYSMVLSNSLNNKPMEGPAMKIKLRTDIEPVPTRVYTATQVPLHFQEEADRTIQEAVEKGIIEPVPDSDQSEWCSRGFFVPKPDGKRLRLVVDLSPLNKYIARPIHPFVAGVDLIKNIKPDSKVFCKLDAVQGYYQISLSKESRPLTTFLLPQGRFRYCRCPMGLNASSDHYNKRSDEIFRGLPGVLKLIDDILIEAPDEDTLFKRIETVLQRCKEHNVILSLSKLAIGEQVPFSGFTISSSGVSPSPERTEAIKAFPTPSNISELRSFLGLANQLGRFLPDLAHISTPLRSLLKKNIKWLWLPEHTDAFEKLKSILTSPLLLKPFDPNCETQVVTDASRLGLGYSLLQTSKNGQIHLVDCSSRSLTEPESRYAVCELEALAILFALKKCRHWLLGMTTFNVISDHKPLLGVFSKEIYNVQNTRLRAIREKLMEFNFTLSWVEGKTHQIADALSRTPYLPAHSDLDLQMNQEKCCIAIQDDPSIQEVVSHVDQAYREVMETIKKYKDPEEIDPKHPAYAYKSVWTRLSLHPKLNLILLDESRMVIPNSYKPKLLQLLHLPHCGITKTRQTAKQFYYWPNMNLDIKNLVENCPTCKSHLPSKPKHQNENSTFNDRPDSPMSKISTDLAERNSKHYLIIVDRYSGYPWCYQLHSLNTAAILKILTSLFNSVGWPQQITSDNGPQFRSEFKQFCKDHQILHIPSSPHNPESNGLAESAVKQVKLLLSKMEGKWNNFENALFAWKNTANNSGHSPAELFFGRRLRSHLPILPAQQKLQECFTIGDQVLIQDVKTNKWTDEGKIVYIHSSGHSFTVQTVDGREIHRNCRYLRSKSSPKQKRVTFQ